MTLIRRAILAFALIAGIAPVFAQAPPPVPALPDTERRTSYTISGTTCACAVGFALYGDSTDYQNWVQVWLNGKQLTYNDPTFGWTITSPTGPLATIPRPVTDAVLTFTVPQTGTVQIVGARRARRASQFQQGQGVAARDLNQLNTDIIAMEREFWDLKARLLQALPGETVNPLPSATSRANNFLAFDVSGNPITTTGITAIQYIASVNYATTAALANSPVYANGTAGVGATLTETGNGALTVDGASPIVGNRILVNNQASTSQNGIYAVTATGNAGTPYVLTRTTDFNTTTAMYQGVSTLVTGGSANIGTGWTLTASASMIGTSPVVFYQTSLSVPNAAANLSFAQDFVAGTGFTAGVTTQLTTTNTPLNSNSSYVLFDGVAQSHNTWSLSGSTYTFNAAIPTNVQVVEIGYVNPSYYTNGVQSIGGVSGPIVIGTNLSMSGQTLNASFPAYGASIENLLPNVQWQLWSGLNAGQSWITKQNSAGTGNQTAISVTSFTPTSQGPSLNTGNTQALRVNDLVITSNPAFWGFAGAGYLNCSSLGGSASCGPQNVVTAMRVTSVNPNTSFSVTSPGFGGVSPTLSAAITVTPIAPGSCSGTNGADGWTKTSTLCATIDDWGAAATPASTAYPGAIRPLLLRKGITGQEIYQWAPSAKTIGKYAGQTMTCAAVVYQRVQGGANTFNLHIDDNTGSSVSANGTGASLGGYQFLTVTRTIPQNITSVPVFYFNLLGNAGDVFDIAVPTCAFTPSLVQSQLKQNTGEIIRATTHWNPPILTPYTIDFPSTELVTGSGLYGYNGIDIEAISFGTVHNTVGNVYAKLEWRTNSVGAICFTGANVNVTNGLTFGLQVSTQVSGIENDTNIGRWPLYHDGTVSIFTNRSGLVMSSGAPPPNGTFDFTDVDVSPPTSVNWLLKRDVDPASNDNDPMWLEKVA